MDDIATRRVRFRVLHESGCFVIPNPWDRGSAVLLESLGFPALASSSAGFAFSRGLPDDPRALSRDAVLDHLIELVATTSIPVSADYQSGYAADPEKLARSVKLCVGTGVAGLSIEDATGDPGRPLFELPDAVERMRAARRAIDETGSGVMLTGRAECFLVGHPDPLRESIRRLQAYAQAGADVLFAPGLPDQGAIRDVVAALAPKPVNVLIGKDMGLRVSDVAELGVRRISVGGALARAAWTGFMKAARAIAERGDFSGFDGVASTIEVSRWFEARTSR
jgi:2-methylisocitrate lyase-like PEP mutase family enzyme